MKMSYLVRLLLLVGTVLSLGAQLQAERIFLSFDQTCIDRMQYTLVTAGKTSPYVVYHINIRPGEKVILTVGFEEENRGENLDPAGFLSCANATFDDNFVNRVNAGTDELFVVTRRSNGTYRVSPVVAAGYYKKTGTVVSYAYSLYRFQFDMRTLSPGALVNWGSQPGTNVYFEEVRDQSCSKIYVLSQLAQQGDIPYMRIVFLPEIGVVEESAGQNPADAVNTRLSLKLVGNQQATQFLAANCGKEPGGHSPAITDYAPASTGYDNPYPAAGQGSAPALSSGQELQPRGSAQQPAQAYPPADDRLTARGIQPAPTQTYQQPAAAPQQTQAYPPAYSAPAAGTRQAAPPQQAPAQTYPPAYGAPAAAAPQQAQAYPPAYSAPAAGTRQAAPPQQAPAQAYPPAYGSTGAQPAAPQQGWQAQAPPAAYSAQGVAPSPANPAAANRSAQAADPFLMHTVQHGETMFQIARRYNLSIDQLYADNDLNARSIIYAGQQVRIRQQPAAQASPDLVARSVAAPAAPPAATPAGWNGSAAAAAPRSAAMPAAAATQSAAPNAPAWRTTNGWHTFAAGETVATVASRYGYTEARFREMNGLSATDFPRIGQQLRTVDNAAPAAADNQFTPRGVAAGSPYTPATVDNQLTPRGAAAGSAYPQTAPTAAPPAANDAASYLPKPYQPNSGNTTAPATAPAARPQTPVLGAPRPSGSQLPANGYDWQK
jgi:LysM repeat protein